MSWGSFWGSDVTTTPSSGGGVVAPPTTAIPVDAGQYVVLQPYADAASIGLPIDEVYQAKPKSYYLFNMLRTLYASGGRLYPAKRGSVVHRFLDGIAVEMARIDLMWRDSIARAIKQSVYWAFRSLFAQPFSQSYATGYATFTRPTPAPQNEIIPAGTLIARADGPTYVTLNDVVVLAGKKPPSPHGP